ncbi:hypothetical protein [Jatrophihabitans fulvus]
MTSTIPALAEAPTGVPAAYPAPAEAVAHHRLHRVLPRELRRLPGLFAALPATDLTVRVRVATHARELLTVTRAHLRPGEGPSREIAELASRAETLLARFPVFDTSALGRCFGQLADVAGRSGWCAGPRSDLGLGLVPRPRRLALVGRLLDGAHPEEKAAVVAALPGPLRSAWTVAGERRHRAELAVLDAIAAGTRRHGPTGIRRTP